MKGPLSKIDNEDMYSRTKSTSNCFRSSAVNLYNNYNNYNNNNNNNNNMKIANNNSINNKSLK